MNEIILFSGIAFWVTAELDQSLGLPIYISWLIAFALTWRGWSLPFAMVCFICAVSYHYASLESTEFFNAIFLPWLAGLSGVIVFIGVIYKYNTLSGDGGGTGSFFDGDGGCGD